MAAWKAASSGFDPDLTFFLGVVAAALLGETDLLVLATTVAEPEALVDLLEGLPVLVDPTCSSMSSSSLCFALEEARPEASSCTRDDRPLRVGVVDTLVEREADTVTALLEVRADLVGVVLAGSSSSSSSFAASASRFLAEPASERSTSTGA